MSRQGRRKLLRGGLALAGFGLVSGCDVSWLPWQRPVSPRHIGYLESGTLESGTVEEVAGSRSPTFEAFRDGMRELGYVEGQNLLIEYRSAEGNFDRLAGLAADLVDSHVEVIVTSQPGEAVKANQGDSPVPIVASGGNLVAAGLVTNIAHPGGTITGVTTNSVGAVGKWVQLLNDTVPGLARLAALGGPGDPVTQAFLQEVQRAAQSLQLQLKAYQLRDLSQLPAVLSTIKADGADALVVLSGSLLGGGRDPRIGGEVLKARLPAVALARAFAVNGGLLAHDANADALAGRSAAYVDKILRGAKPGDLPIEQPSRFNIVINLNTAEALGLTIPPSVLQQATEVIQ